jgi:hypothetical protein
MMRMEGSMFFFEKKNQKTFATWSRAGRTGAALNVQKFFASFFQKRSPSLCRSSRNVMQYAPPPDRINGDKSTPCTA